VIQACQLPNDEDAYLARWLIGISHQLNLELNDIRWDFRDFFFFITQPVILIFQKPKKCSGM
jgi:hypothetical protein